MNKTNLNRRQFIQQTAALLGTAFLPPSFIQAAAVSKRTAADQVSLGKTGLKISRLGFGAGSNSGNVQKGLGQETFNKLIRYAYDQGITYIDCAQSYATFEWIGKAIKGLPREKLFIQSKISGQPQDILAAIDRHRKIYDTDYVDSMLIHCMVKDGWTDQMKRMMDGFDEAKSKKWILAKGVSCHSLPALKTSVATDWTDVHLVRVNPQGKWVDGPAQQVFGGESDLPSVMEEIKKMHTKGHGVIGMKLVGNGEFQNPEDREKAIRYAMAQSAIDSVVIGFKSKEEIDEAIQRINRALAEA